MAGLSADLLIAYLLPVCVYDGNSGANSGQHRNRYCPFHPLVAGHQFASRKRVWPPFRKVIPPEHGFIDPQHTSLNPDLVRFPKVTGLAENLNVGFGIAAAL